MRCDHCRRIRSAYERPAATNTQNSNQAATGQKSSKLARQHINPLNLCSFTKFNIFIIITRPFGVWNFVSLQYFALCAASMFLFILRFTSSSLSSAFLGLSRLPQLTRPTSSRSAPSPSSALFPSSHPLTLKPGAEQLFHNCCIQWNCIFIIPLTQFGSCSVYCFLDFIFLVALQWKLIVKCWLYFMDARSFVLHYVEHQSECAFLPQFSCNAWLCRTISTRLPFGSKNFVYVVYRRANWIVYGLIWFHCVLSHKHAHNECTELHLDAWYTVTCYELWAMVPSVQTPSLTNILGWRKIGHANKQHWLPPAKLHDDEWIAI